MGDLVTGGMVRALIQEKVILVKSISIIDIGVSDTLYKIRHRVKSLKIAFMSCPRDHTDEAFRPMYDLLIKSRDLLKKYKTVSKWQLFDKRQCLDELDKVDKQIVASIERHLQDMMHRWFLPEAPALVTPVVVGELLGDNVIVLEEIIEETIELFRPSLRSILNSLKVLKDVFDDLIREDDQGQTDRPDEVLRPLYDMLRSCQLFVTEFMFLKKWQLYDKHQCIKKFHQLDNQIATYISVLDAVDESLLKLEQVEALCDYEYDVFLSFRGDDTRESFTSTIFYLLGKVHKVKTFMDERFKKGSKLEELLTMVEKSRMSIVIFSENFVESEWCLKELVKIFQERDQRGHEVVPVFYKVDPSELRHQDTGKTKEHMKKHQNKYGKDSDIVKSWSNAIKELGNSSGYTYWSGKGKQEVQLAEEIARDILNRLPGRKDGEQGSSSSDTH